MKRYTKRVRNARGSNGTTLYNLLHDIGEKNDVSANHAERFKRMQADLDAWKTDVETGATPQP